MSRSGQGCCSLGTCSWGAGVTCGHPGTPRPTTAGNSMVSATAVPRLPGEPDMRAAVHTHAWVSGIARQAWKWCSEV